jgi:hypothetical protein
MAWQQQNGGKKCGSKAREAQPSIPVPSHSPALHAPLLLRLLLLLLLLLLLS